MKKDKLQSKSEIQSKFKDKSKTYIKFVTLLCKLTRFLYSDISIFITSLIPIIVALFIEVGEMRNSELIVFMLLLLIVHYPVYKFVIKKYFYKNSEEILKQHDLYIEFLNENKMLK